MACAQPAPGRLFARAQLQLQRGGAGKFARASRLHCRTARHASELSLALRVCLTGRQPLEQQAIANREGKVLNIYLDDLRDVSGRTGHGSVTADRHMRLRQAAASCRRGVLLLHMPVLVFAAATTDSTLLPWPQYLSEVDPTRQRLLEDVKNNTMRYIGIAAEAADEAMPPPEGLPQADIYDRLLESVSTFARGCGA